MRMRTIETAGTSWGNALTPGCTDDVLPLRSLAGGIAEALVCVARMHSPITGAEGIVEFPQRSPHGHLEGSR